MAYNNLIDTNYLYDNTVIDRNVDTALLVPFIVQSQDIHIQQVIGNSLYVYLMNNKDTLTGDYLTLYTDYIKKAQAQWTLYLAIPYLNYKVTNKGIVEKNSDYSKATELDNVKYLRQTVRDTAEFLSQRIREFIVNHPNSFPEYYENFNIDTIKPKQDNYFGGIYLGKY